MFLLSETSVRDHNRLVRLHYPTTPWCGSRRSETAGEHPSTTPTEIEIERDEPVDITSERYS